ncbi:MAG: hypothetical protein KKG47_16830 [Proteobacteria bacterium]|nr:hypothetical protein [Pseudomonadota bacterium]MBU1736510.1 hypothetical protein [Pseudomonadota bacterium]
MMNKSTKQILYILLFFATLIAGILASEFFDFGKPELPTQDNAFTPGSRLEQIRKGMTKK